ncbi:Putative Alpha-galactosidase [Rhizopus microsporus]|nr:Putative Alpha-galactosidase [Rhizopus microsporus]
MKILYPGISRHPSKNQWFLVTNNSTYVIGIVDNVLLNLHWGPRLVTMQDVELPAELEKERSSQDPAITSAREECPFFGGLRYGPDLLRAIFANGTKELDLIYHSSTLDQHTLKITLVDRVYDYLKIELEYTLDIENDMIIRGAILSGTNDPEKCFYFTKSQTAAWHLGPPAHGTHRELVTLAGAWSSEMQVQTHSMKPGTSHVLSSVRGIPSAQAYPYFAIKDQAKDGEYTNCEVYFGTLGWSGNWSIEVSTDIESKTRIIGGWHDREPKIKVNRELALPLFVAGFAPDGLSGARKRLTRHIRKEREQHLNEENILSPVLYNGWEACGFGVNIKNQMDMASKAAKLGAELFVLDDGWFKGRHLDDAGLGDWYVDQTKFPEGLKPLSDHVHKLGMKFGLWFEPEMVNPDSDLYRQHPEWVYHYTDRPRHLERNQLVLNITRKDVREYILSRMRDIISRANVDFIKWDMNRPISEANGDGVVSWIMHPRFVHAMMEKLKQEFKHLRIETCASGGGRADLSMLKKTDLCWPSDNTRPDARLKIQYGASFVMPPNMMSCWVTDMPNDDVYCIFPISYRFHVSFMGALGIGSDLTKLSEAELELYRGWIELYKTIRPIQQKGDLEFLVPPDSNRTHTVITQTTIEEGKASVVLAFRESSPFWLPLSPIRLRNLKKLCVYHVQIWEDNPFVPVFTGDMTGGSLMAKGLPLPYLTSKAYSSVVILLQTKIQ